MQEHYRQDLEELYQELGTCPEGLSSDTAAKCQEKYGKNAIAEGKKKPTLLIFLEQFKDFLVIILNYRCTDFRIYRRSGELSGHHCGNHHERHSGNGANGQGGKIPV